MKASMPQTCSRDRVLVWLVVAIIVLFQSHWLDDLGSGEPDVAGRTVSAIGTCLLSTGVLLRNAAPGRALLAFALLFTAGISGAELAGFRADGTRISDRWAYWQGELGWIVTATVMVTLLLAVMSVSLLARSQRTRSLPT
jgi:hypothetical protein